MVLCNYVKQTKFLYSVCVFGNQFGISLVYWVGFVKIHCVLFASNAQCVGAEVHTVPVMRAKAGVII